MEANLLPESEWQWLPMSNLFRLFGRFGKDQRGNIAVIFAIACVPIISAVGCAVDYSMATRLKAKLQSAADAASVAAISQKSAGYIAAAAMTCAFQAIVITNSRLS